MGDRTTCTIIVRERDLEAIYRGNYGIKNFDELLKKVYVEEHDIIEGIVELIDYQANYGNWDSLTDMLDAENIEYDHRWESGGDYGAGEKSHRLVDGVMLTHEMYDENQGEWDLIHRLHELLKEDKIEEVIKDIKETYQRMAPPFEIKPLEARVNSVEFVKEEG
jgi:hypothetical protein